MAPAHDSHPQAVPWCRVVPAQDAAAAGGLNPQDMHALTVSGAHSSCTTRTESHVWRAGPEVWHAVKPG